MIKDLINVYEWLCDEKSKEIFINRLNYNITKDFNYVADIVDNYCDEVRNEFSWRKFLKNIKEASLRSKVIICGAGLNGNLIYEFLSKHGIKVECFCDRNEKASVKSGVNVISYEKLFDISREEEISIIIATEIYFDEIHNYLLENGIDERKVYGGKADITTQYFEQELLELKDEEYFVDCGALDLETTKSFLSLCNKGGSYAFEPDKDNYEKCLEIKEESGLNTVEIYNFGCGSKEEKLKFSSNKGYSSNVNENGDTEIEVTTLDKILKDKRVTFIKMDIEGMELEALEGAKEVIKKNKPKMAISIYHKDEDLITIPSFIKEIVPEYRFYIRHYSLYQSETVLYAVI